MYGNEKNFNLFPPERFIIYPSAKILISGFPLNAQIEKFYPLLNLYGVIQNCKQIKNLHTNTWTIEITLQNHEQANEIAKKLNNVAFQGTNLRIKLLERTEDKCKNDVNDWPLKIIVRNDLLKCLMARPNVMKNVICQKARQTHTRLEVHKIEDHISLETPISIHGKPDNCTRMCQTILELMQQAIHKTNDEKISLKILMHEFLISSIIDKENSTLKNIMTETNTKITVSNTMNKITMEQTITVEGAIENISKCESKISAIFRQCYASDLRRLKPHNKPWPELRPFPMTSCTRKTKAGCSESSELSTDGSRAQHVVDGETSQQYTIDSPYIPLSMPPTRRRGFSSGPRFSSMMQQGGPSTVKVQQEACAIQVITSGVSRFDCSRKRGFSSDPKYSTTKQKWDPRTQRYVPQKVCAGQAITSGFNHLSHQFPDSNAMAGRSKGGELSLRSRSPTQQTIAPLSNSWSSMPHIAIKPVTSKKMVSSSGSGELSSGSGSSATMNELEPSATG